MFKNMALHLKISLGFGLLILIALLLGSMAVWNMTTVKGKATMLAEEYVPEVKAANNVERHSMLTMYNMRGYALSDQEQYWTEAVKELENVKGSLAEAQALSAKAVHLVKLKGAVELASKGVDAYEKLAKQTQARVKELEEDRRQLNETARKFSENTVELQKRQHEMMAEEISGKVVSVADKNPAHGEKAAEHAAAPAEIAPAACPAGETALAQLINGNARYVAMTPQHPNGDQQRRSETSAKGQHPEATIVGCSDSRVPAELVFDRGIGELFIVRVAGNVCGGDEIGSVEYGSAIWKRRCS